ncbi:MerR family transcriptional regulator [Pseudomonas sp. M30-35]|uniref:MerR family transcriptional regulator n=1 Tax=Pseudomonas sp. M30-35 TaxID=1981174 RepID=UPI000B3C73A6|nr:MerR family transcriptional regulator [Pseudomonas sp. M30-35]ARU87486.1 helix-turn-helix-type transcriptional regulator [Pseudomonas sp. M30-35]
MSQAKQAPAENEYQLALAEGFRPIRDVARITGVNPVTLRAWERRYGLIVPQRTAKGHRLYSEQHIAQIQAILMWINRGVSVSQVKVLLHSTVPTRAEADGQWPDSQWSEKSQQLLEAVSKLAERRLDDVFNSELALYPPTVLCSQLLLPLLNELEQRWRGQFGARLEQVFFYSWLRSKLGARVYHNNRQHTGEPLLMVNCSDLPMAPGLWLSAWLASSAQAPVEVFDWPVPQAELSMAMEHIRPSALLLYSTQPLNISQLPTLLEGCASTVLITGPTVTIHHAELQTLGARYSNLTIAIDPIIAMQVLADRHLLEDA